MWYLPLILGFLLTPRWVGLTQIFDSSTQLQDPTPVAGAKVALEEGEPA